MAEECIFCKIAQHQGPASIVYEDSETLAFMDIAPVSKGHVLVIPKRHFVNIFDISDECASAVMRTVRLLSPKIKEAMNADGVNITNNSSLGHLPHFHVHIIPRFKNDGLAPWPRAQHSVEDINRFAASIKAAADSTAKL